MICFMCMICMICMHYSHIWMILNGHEWSSKYSMFSVALNIFPQLVECAVAILFLYSCITFSVHHCATLNMPPSKLMIKCVTRLQIWTEICDSRGTSPTTAQLTTHCRRTVTSIFSNLLNIIFIKHKICPKVQQL